MENQGSSRGNGERTFEEIGDALGITAGTARALYARGIRKLRSRRNTPLLRNLMNLVESKANLR
jgi:DNA-directed RNA polymerase sigma subunit (sigma70/sigma32)